MPFFFLNSEYTSAVGFSSSSMAPCRAEENLKLPVVHNTNYKVCQTLEQLAELFLSGTIRRRGFDSFFQHVFSVAVLMLVSNVKLESNWSSLFQDVCYSAVLCVRSADTITGLTWFDLVLFLCVYCLTICSYVFVKVC